MTSIGRFGTQHAKIEQTFEFFDLTVRVNPSCSQAAMVEFLAEAGEVEQADEVRGSRLIMAFMREIVHPDDFDAFWTKAKLERQDPETDLMPIAHAVMEAISDFPTGPPSGSVGGSTPTGQRFVVDAPLPELPTPNLAAGSTASQALAMLRKRPDLQEFVVQADEAKKEKVLA